MPVLEVAIIDWRAPRRSINKAFFRFTPGALPAVIYRRGRLTSSLKRREGSSQIRLRVLEPRNRSTNAVAGLKCYGRCMNGTRAFAATFGLALLLVGCSPSDSPPQSDPTADEVPEDPSSDVEQAALSFGPWMDQLCTTANATENLSVNSPSLNRSTNDGLDAESIAQARQYLASVTSPLDQVSAALAVPIDTDMKFIELWATSGSERVAWNSAAISELHGRLQTASGLEALEMYELYEAGDLSSFSATLFPAFDWDEALEETGTTQEQGERQLAELELYAAEHGDCSSTVGGMGANFGETKVEDPELPDSSVARPSLEALSLGLSSGDLGLSADAGLCLAEALLASDLSNEFLAAMANSEDDYVPKGDDESQLLTLLTEATPACVEAG